MTERPTKITFAEMRDMGVRGLLVYCVTINGDYWPDDLRLSDIELTRNWYSFHGSKGRRPRK